MTPPNTRAKTNHREATEDDSLHSLQQHLGLSAFMSSESMKLNQQDPCVSTQEAPNRNPVAPLERRPEPKAPRPVHSRIASSERALSWMEIAPETILTPAFIATLFKLLDRRGKEKLPEHPVKQTHTGWKRTHPGPNISQRCPRRHI